MASVLPQVTVISPSGSMVRPVGVQIKAHITGLFLRQGLPEILGPPGDGVLVKVLPADLRQPVQNGPGRVEVREALGEVHRAVLVGNAGHAPDDRVGEAGGALRQALHGRVLPKNQI